VKTFWMVVRRADGARTPVVEHLSLDEAVTEAHRLAEKSPGVSFVVLQAMGEVIGTARVDVAEIPMEQP
jgi:hypothetical protein